MSHGTQSRTELGGGELELGEECGQEPGGRERWGVGDRREREDREKTETQQEGRVGEAHTCREKGRRNNNHTARAQKVGPRRRRGKHGARERERQADI